MGRCSDTNGMHMLRGVALKRALSTPQQRCNTVADGHPVTSYTAWNQGGGGSCSAAAKARLGQIQSRSRYRSSPKMVAPYAVSHVYHSALAVCFRSNFLWSRCFASTNSASQTHGKRSQGTGAQAISLLFMRWQVTCSFFDLRSASSSPFVR